MTPKAGSLVSEERLRELIGLAYDAAAEPTGWTPFLEALARSLRATLPGMALVDLRTQEASIDAFPGLDPAMYRAYEEYYKQCDLRRRALQKCPAGTVIAGHELVPNSDLLESEFYNDFLRPAGLFQIAFALPIQDGKRAAMVRVIRRREEPPFGSDELQVLSILLPHVRRSLQIHSQLARSRAEAAVASAGLDALRVAVLFLDSSGRVVAQNRAAARLLARQDGLSLDRGELRAAAGDESAVLHRLIGSACAVSASQLEDPGGAMHLSRPSGARPLSVLIAPILSVSSELGAPGAAALAFVTDPDERAALCPDTLKRLYEFTPAETRLVAMLAEGRSLREAAARLGVGYETVKSQAQAAREKTGTRTVTELVSVLLRGPAYLATRNSGHE